MYKVSDIELVIKTKNLGLSPEEHKAISDQLNANMKAQEEEKEEALFDRYDRYAQN